MPAIHHVGAALERCSCSRVEAVTEKSALKSAIAPMMMVSAAMNGDMKPITEVSLRSPNQTVTIAAAAIIAEPATTGMPKYWWSVVPAPESMIR